MECQINLEIQYDKICENLEAEYRRLTSSLKSNLNSTLNSDSNSNSNQQDNDSNKDKDKDKNEPWKLHLIIALKYYGLVQPSSDNREFDLIS
jgi:hypothetical protein